MPDPLTDDEITAIRAVLGPVQTLLTGLAAAGLTDPAALAAAGTLVKREQLNAQLVTEQAAIDAQVTTLNASRAAHQQKVNDINAQIAALNQTIGQGS